MKDSELVKVIVGLVGPISGAVAAILVVALIGLGVFLRRYLEQKAGQLATREDFKTLQDQVAQSTRLVESIKSELSNKDWVRRELHVLRMKKIEELMTLALNSEEDLTASRNAAIEGRYYDRPLHHDRMYAVATVYLPELEPAVMAYRDALLTHSRQIGRKSLEVSKDGTGEWGDFMTTSNYNEVLSNLDALKAAVAKLLLETSSGTVFR